MCFLKFLDRIFITETGFCLRAVRTEFYTHFRLISVFKGLKDGPWGRTV